MLRTAVVWSLALAHGRASSTPHDSKARIIEQFNLSHARAGPEAVDEAVNFILQQEKAKARLALNAGHHAAHPNATIIGEARDSSAPPPTPLSSGGWTFSPELSATQLDEIRGLIAMNGLTPPPPPTAEDDADATAGTADAPVPDADDDGAAEAAFAALVDAHPGAREIAPGIFACDS